jgi:glycosyltransferase involved in cell wall biosynthesis
MRSSFGLVAAQHIRWLRRLGVEVIERDVAFDRRALDGAAGTDLAIVHPLFLHDAWRGVGFDEVAAALGRHHRTVVGVEVSDSTRISARFASWADHPAIAGIVVPSTFSERAFRDAGVRNAMAVVPHGVAIATPSDRFASLRGDPPRSCVLFFATMFGHRKGWDLARAVAEEIPEHLVVVKGASEASAHFGDLPNVALVEGWLGEADLASLYLSCDVLLSPHRGGAFELSCAEAAAYGLPVVATRFGGVTDYLTDDAAALVDPSGTELLDPPGTDVAGLGAIPDLEAMVAAVRATLSDLPRRRAQAQACSERTRATLSWERATQQLLGFVVGRPGRLRG